ncbi:helix-turn-helix domain-containing protein [Kordiimonas pumila]|uniref:Helix-turn-helix domain-containing protein n=1 Tax=Kordiimonas pumila TaxID=2161677 RepID=A0ABV7D9B6_9PROT
MRLIALSSLFISIVLRANQITRRVPRGRTFLHTRSFTRHFRQEMKVSFLTWRHLMRLHEALPRLSLGEKVSTVAYDLGYNSLSGFSAIFIRIFGIAPSKGTWLDF